ncbi:MAG: hypothetical protein GF384_00675 [Elusimicrobia bacterium]|nr:hypothetical protein [Elusimicrobiota bacterium]MBD3411598.1 hypothetical protein [Elusimicrobiota bacterium]
MNRKISRTTRLLYLIFKALNHMGIESLGFGIFKRNHCGIMLFKIIKHIDDQPLRS